ncbi:hypothetical protein [Mangrovimonas futianensis]|uniref:hypothetical protein n=1 Tax=Mangrovimonas futianensis TaxID=2895523 RepID=UPI001E4D2547|nr:hypothetical protein [Mangrovimonas futianensis]MCF1420980.1 hypothetical protein [Mangrovimonas futianensis]
MEHVKLFKRRKQLSIAIGVVGFLFILLVILDRTTELGIGEHFPLMGFIFVIQMFLNFGNFKKYFFQFDKQRIKWRFPGMAEPKVICISEDSMDITTNWKGVQINHEDQYYEILTDGLWKGEKKLIYKTLKQYYS